MSVLPSKVYAYLKKSMTLNQIPWEHFKALEVTHFIFTQYKRAMAVIESESGHRLSRLFENFALFSRSYQLVCFYFCASNYLK